VIFVVPALLFGSALLLFRALLRRRAYWCEMLAFPAAWVTFEYLTSLVSPHGTAGSLAYSQLNFLPFLQLASVTGPSGMSFVLLLFSSALVVGFCTHRTASKQAIQIVSAGVGLVALVLIFGFVRLSLPASAKLVKVGLIASDLPQNIDVAQEGAATERLLRDYAARAESLAAAGADVIVIPEKLGVVTDADVEQTDALLQGIADRTGSTIVAGVVDIASPVEYNQARVYRPQSA
jgi:apolipoprotein N-acyltransferase